MRRNAADNPCIASTNPRATRPAAVPTTAAHALAASGPDVLIFAPGTAFLSRDAGESFEAVDWPADPDCSSPWDGAE